jgi:hypothetical protein
MFFSFCNRDRPQLYFDNVQLNFVEHHKHLGVTLSQDGSWHEHITNIVSSASKILRSMKMIKFKVQRSTLNNIYISYLRPRLEYASLLWDNCTQYEKDILEKMQYEAARIVTGLTRSVSIQNLLKEIGWVSLAERRKIQKLVLVYKDKHNLLPLYLSQLFLPLVENANENQYNLRNNINYVTMTRRTEIYSKSVIPSSIQLWNELSVNIRESDSLANFKRKLKEIYKPPIVPSYFINGERSSTVYHTRLRNNCSNLNSDLYNNHITQNPACECGALIEDAEHFLFQCKKFNHQRIELFRNTREFHPLSTQKLLFGINTLTNSQNMLLFHHVHRFIKETKRFI